MTDWTKIAPPFIPASQSRCDTHANLAAIELFRAIQKRPYVAFSRNWLSAMCRLRSGFPPSLDDIIYTASTVGLVTAANWPGSNFPETATPSADVNATASAYKAKFSVQWLLAEFFMSRDIAAAKSALDAGHPLVFVGSVYNTWPTGSGFSTDPTEPMYQVPVPDPATQAFSYRHAWPCYGYTDVGFITREARSDKWQVVPFPYPCSWLAITDVIETAVDPGNPDVAALIVEMDSLYAALAAQPEEKQNELEHRSNG